MLHHRPAWFDNYAEALCALYHQMCGRLTGHTPGQSSGNIFAAHAILLERIGVAIRISSPFFATKMALQRATRSTRGADVDTLSSCKQAKHTPA